MICSKENGSELFIDDDDRLLDYDSSKFESALLCMKSNIVSSIMNKNQMIWGLPYNAELEYDKDPNFGCKSIDNTKINDVIDSEENLTNVGIAK